MWSSSTHQTFIVWPHYLAKQTLLLISVLIREREHFSQSQRYGVGRSISYGEDKGGLHRFWSESQQFILLQYRTREGSAAWHQHLCSRLTALWRYINFVLWLWWLLLLYVIITGGHCSRMERQRTTPGQRWTTVRKKSTSTSLNWKL